VWFGAAEVPRAATIGDALTGRGIGESGTLAVGGFTDPATAAVRSFPDEASMSCLLDAQTPGASDADCPGRTRKDRSAPLPGLASGAVSDLDVEALGISAGIAAFDSTPLQSSFDGFWITASGAALEQLDDLVKERQNVDDPNAWWIIDPSWLAEGDIYVKDAVPALAVVALSVAGLLLFGLVRRRRRTALARRIKRSAGRRRPRFRS
jgi:hypothetical protein